MQLSTARLYAESRKTANIDKCSGTFLIKPFVALINIPVFNDEQDV